MPLLFSLSIHNAFRGDSTAVGARRIPLRIPGRRVRLVFTRTDSCVVQFTRYNVARTSGHPVAHGQDTHVELRKRAPGRHGGSWTRCVEPRRDQDPRDPRWASGVSNFRRAAVGRRAKTAGRHPFSAGPAMRLATPPPMRRAALPPLAADRAPHSVIQVRARARRGDATHHGSVVGFDSRRRCPGRDGTAHHDFAFEDGRIGSSVGAEDGTSSILGFVDGCIAHVAATPS